MAYPTLLSPPQNRCKNTSQLHCVGQSCHYTVVQVILHWVKRSAFQENWH